MITNIPSSQELNRSALTSFFAAWHSLIQLFHDFDQTYGFENPDWADELQDYYEHCQAEIETIYALAAQASELALKARICDVNPYLLLLGGSASFGEKSENIDFSELRTIDAVDLPSAVNAICPEKLSEQFKQRFTQVRKLRNRIAHLGASGEAFDPKGVLSLLVAQYCELWPGAQFLSNWFAYISSRRFSFFHDGKWQSAELEFADVYETCFDMLSSGQFEKLIGFSKTQRRYICHKCIYSGGLNRHGMGAGQLATAFLIEETLLLCKLCTEKSSVARRPCSKEECKGNVISLEDPFLYCCNTCGEEQDDDFEGGTPSASA